MKLSKKDKEFLCDRLFYEASDIPVIENAITKMRYTHYISDDDCGKLINQKDAVEILGRYGFLSGCARATFHWSSSRRSEGGKHEILFERK